MYCNNKPLVGKEAKVRIFTVFVDALMELQMRLAQLSC
jgi:hypothetical protein